MKTLSLALSATFLLSTAAMAENHHHHHGDNAFIDDPIGQMGAHTHGAGDWMASYRYSRMAMNENYDGNNAISDAAVLQNFMVSPTDMEMDMHMFGLMYAPSDAVTLGVMLPYLHKSMNHITRMGGRFETQSRGIGDVKLSGLVPVYQEGAHQIHLNAKVSLPTGSIDEKDQTPAGFGRLPYPMQLGSGTVDLLPGVTYRYQQQNWTLGSQLQANLRLGRNDNDYSLGDSIRLSSWGSYRVNDSISTSLRLDGSIWGDIDGADKALNTALVPTARTDLQGGKRIDASLGLNFAIPHTRGQQLGIEIGTPLYQKLDGPQMAQDWKITAGWLGNF